MKDDKRLFLDCDCGSHLAIEITTLWEDEPEYTLVNISFWQPCFYVYQGGILQNIIERFKMILQILFKGEYFLHDILLKPEEAKKLEHYLHSFTKDMDPYLK